MVAGVAVAAVLAAGVAAVAVLAVAVLAAGVGLQLASLVVMFVAQTVVESPGWETPSAARRVNYPRSERRTSSAPSPPPSWRS